MKNILISNGKNSSRYEFIDKNLAIIANQEITDVRSFVNEYLNQKDQYVIYVLTTRNTESALSYSGVELALWIYLIMVLEGRLQFHIVLLGTETKGAFFEHCRYANLILAPNVHYVLNSKQAIECFLENTDTTRHANKDILVQALKGITVEPPAAFKNVHTITNEWCVYRWSKALGITGIDNEVDKSLYFTYLKTILSISEAPMVLNTCTSNNKVLVIDDEMDKGWRPFFESLLSGHVQCMGEDFKRAKTRDEIIQQVKAKVMEYNPDTIILDLRLHDSDHNNIDPNVKLTGVKVLEEVKRINKGIQVIGFTASNKVWNLLSWQQLGIDNFIIKESPSKSVEEGYTERSIKQLIDAIEQAASKAYLKNIYKVNHDVMEKLRKLSNKKTRLISKEMANAIIGYIKLAQSSLFAAKPNHDTAFMYYFLILEAFAKQMIDENGIEGKDGLYYFQFRRDQTYLMIFNEKTGKKTHNKLYCGKKTENSHSRIPYAQKLYNVIEHVGLTDIDPVSLVKIRNDFNHPDFIDSKPVVLDYQNVLDIMNVVCSLINNYR